MGISHEVGIVNLDSLDRVISVDDGDAILMSQKLASELGLGVGISSGANFIGALLVQNDLGNDSLVVTVFPDDNKKYLSTDLLREEPVQDNFFTPDIKLLSFRAFKRVCTTCCDPLECTENLSLDFIEGEEAIPPCPLRN